MPESIVITDSVGVSDIEKFMTEVLRKQGIRLHSVNLICLYPVGDPKDIFVSMDIRIPIGSRTDIVEIGG